MMTVRELATQVGVTSNAVRYYVRIGLLHPERNASNGYRLFAVTDIKRLRFLLRAKKLGFTLTEIRQIFADSENGHLPCPTVRDILKRRIHENKKTIDELILLQQRMEEAQKKWEGIVDTGTGLDITTDNKIICPLIEHLAA